MNSEIMLKDLIKSEDKAEVEMKTNNIKHGKNYLKEKLVATKWVMHLEDD